MKITFNGHDLSKFISVTNAERALLPTIENQFTVVPARAGSIYQWDRVGLKEIKISYYMNTETTQELQQLKRELAGILKTSEPAVLVLSDEPELYYMAKLDGETTVDQLLGAGLGQLTFTCADPFAYSAGTRTVVNNVSAVIPDFTSKPATYKKGDTWLVAENDFNEGRNLFKYSQMKIYRGGTLHEPNASNTFSYLEKRITVTNDSQSLIGAKIDCSSSKEITLSGVTSLSSVIAYYFQPYNSAGNKIGGQVNGSTVVNSEGYFSKSFDLNTFPDISYIILGLGRLATSNYWIEPKVEVGLKATPWTPAPEDPVTITMDMKGKTAGSSVENPNKFSRNSTTVLASPTGSWTENDQARIDAVKELGGATPLLSWSGTGALAQALFSWHLLETIRRKYSHLKEISVTDLKSLVTELSINAWAKGSSPLGNVANFKVWLRDTSWEGSIVNTTNAIALMTYAPQGSSIPIHIASDGNVYALVYADAANGTIASSISPDYANLVVKLIVPRPYIGKLMIATKSSDEFNIDDWEVYVAETDSLTAINNGTAETYPIMKAKIKSETGFLGLINQKGQIVQLGNPDEVDGYNYTKSEMLFNDHLNVDKGWLLNEGITPNVTPVREQKGTVAYVQETATEGYVKVVDYGPEIDTGWRGASITKIVPADTEGKYALNWTSNYRMDFNTDGENNDAVARSQVGHNSVSYVDQRGNIIASVVIEDNNRVSRKSDLALYVNNVRIWDTRETDSFYVTGREADHTSIRVEKFGSEITFAVSMGNITRTFTSAIAEDAELRKVTWYGAVFGKGNPPITNNLLRALHVVKHNVQKRVDIPNTFQPEDEVVIDFMDGSIKVNGVTANKLGAVGNDYFPLFSGENDIACLYSSWTQIAPEISLEYREAYL